MRLIGVVIVSGLLLSSLLADPPKPAPTKGDEPMAKQFSAQKGAEFLDGVNLQWTREKKCFSCHTNVMYMMARPQISGGDDSALKELRTFAETSVTTWQTKKPRNDYEVLTTAFALAANDSVTTKKLHEQTKNAWEMSWKLQKADGSWNWPDCDWPPMEHDQYYGVVFMAVGVALAPDNYMDSPTAQAGIEKIRTYLKKNAPPELHHKAMLLWASLKIDGILPESDRPKIIKELLAKQREDGGWSLPSLGTYKRRDGTMNDPNAPSDGYATGFVLYVLRQAGVKADDPAIQKGVQWLQANQRESGRWYTRSVSNDKAHYITNAGSSFAVLALAACNVEMK